MDTRIIEKSVIPDENAVVVFGIGKLSPIHYHAEVICSSYKKFYPFVKHMESCIQGYKKIAGGGNKWSFNKWLSPKEVNEVWLKN